MAWQRPFTLDLTLGNLGERANAASRMHNTGCAGASEARVLDNIDPLAKLAA